MKKSRHPLLGTTPDPGVEPPEAPSQQPRQLPGQEEVERSCKTFGTPPQG